MADQREITWAGAENQQIVVQSWFTSTVRGSAGMSGVSQTQPQSCSMLNGETAVLWSGSAPDKSYEYSGRVTSTLKDSADLSTLDGNPAGISSDRTDTWVAGNTNDKIFELSGIVTTTIHDSYDTNLIDSAPLGSSIDSFANVLWSGNQADKLYYQSALSTTIKDSEYVGATDVNPTEVQGYHGHAVWTGAANDLLLYQSGKYTSTIRDSVDVTLLDAAPRGIEVRDTARLGFGSSSLVDAMVLGSRVNSALAG